MCRHGLGNHGLARLDVNLHPQHVLAILKSPAVARKFVQLVVDRPPLGHGDLVGRFNFPVLNQVLDHPLKRALLMCCASLCWGVVVSLASPGAPATRARTSFPHLSRHPVVRGPSMAPFRIVIGLWTVQYQSKPEGTQLPLGDYTYHGVRVQHVVWIPRHSTR